MKKIYLVRGSQADYSDRWEWIVSAYTDVKVATAEAARLNATMLALKTEDYWNPFEHEDEIEEVDPKSSGWSWPPRYNVIEVPFHA